MALRIARLIPIFLVLRLSLETTAAPPSSVPMEERLHAHVETLASQEFGGRRGQGGEKAAEYIVEHFRKLRLEPLFDGSYFQDVPGRPTEPILGRNVGALLRGSDPKLREEWVVVSAHYDHLGMRGEVFFPGADDNASGVAMMLETARCIMEAEEKPRRSIMFVGFDLEEAGLFGSRYFVEHSPVNLDALKLFITADMIGRALGGVCEPFVFVMGAEHAPGLQRWLEDAGKGSPVRVGLLGSDLLLINRSDYGPFRARKIPYLFFSTGENPLYHTPQDVAETVNYPKLESISRIILNVARDAARSDHIPEWKSSPENSFAEAVTIRDVVRILLEHRESLKIGAVQTFLMSNALRTLDDIVKRGEITPEERIGVIRVARLILISIF